MRKIRFGVLLKFNPKKKKTEKKIKTNFKKKKFKSM